MPESSLIEINIIKRLQKHGIITPLRYKKIIQNAISYLKLDLSGLVVLTEAASCNYLFTPIIAAMAGANSVYAVTRDSIYGKAEEITDATTLFAQLSGVSDRVDIVTQKSPEVVSKADIVTNLGFVRPIDSQMVEMMKSTAVVPLMCEAWEYRPNDVDLDACRQKGVLVLGTNENYPGMEVFQYCGWLCLKMLLDAQIEIMNSKIVIMSGDKFGLVIDRFLSNIGADVHLTNDLREHDLIGVDALVIADYIRNDQIVGMESHINPKMLATVSPGITIIQFAGSIDVRSLHDHGIYVYPGIDLAPNRMAQTLAKIGARPVIELHALGLKVGEIAARLRLKGMNEEKLKSAVLNYDVIQPLLR